MNARDVRETLVHGTAVALPARGEGQAASAVLLRGLSGSGKSDLALRLVEEGALLVADDQVALRRTHDKIYADGIDPLRGLLEVRGLGILRLKPAGHARLRLIVDLVAREDVPRLPPAGETADILGVAVARLSLHGYDAATPAKIRFAVQALDQPQLLLDQEKVLTR